MARGGIVRAQRPIHRIEYSEFLASEEMEAKFLRKKLADPLSWISCASPVFCAQRLPFPSERRDLGRGQSVSRRGPPNRGVVSRASQPGICQYSPCAKRAWCRRMDRRCAFCRRDIVSLETSVACARHHNYRRSRWDVAKRIAEAGGAPASAISGRLVCRLVGLQFRQWPYHWGDVALWAIAAVCAACDKIETSTKIDNPFRGHAGDAGWI